MDGTIRVRTAAWFATAVVLSVVATLLVTQAWSVGAAPGAADSTFVPTSPCRLFDYRPAPNTVGPRSAPLGAGDTHVQQVTGSNGDCVGALAIPSTAVAVAMNVTAVNPTAQSNLRVFPADVATVPTVSNLNFSAGQKPVPNKVDVKLSPDGRIKLFNFAGSVSVVGDVVGYYSSSTLKELSDKIVALEMAQPFTESTEVFAPKEVSRIKASPTNLISVTVNASVAGRVSVHVSAAASGGDVTADRILCTITTGGVVASPLLTASPMMASAVPGLAGIRTFDVAAGSSTEFKLLCYASTAGVVPEVQERTMTAIFTPAG